VEPKDQVSAIQPFWHFGILDLLQPFSLQDVQIVASDIAAINRILDCR